LSIEIRLATLDDAATLTAHRRGMFRDMGYRDDAALNAMAEKFLPWLKARMRAGEYLAWLATAEDGRVAAGAGLWLMDWPPHMIGSGRRGNILNVYTHPDFRRRGLARRVTEAAMLWCGQNGIDCVILHASKEGRPLYQALGFEPTNEMRILLNRQRIESLVLSAALKNRSVRIRGLARVRIARPSVPVMMVVMPTGSLRQILRRHRLPGL